jgi:HSP20 family protein
MMSNEQNLTQRESTTPTVEKKPRTMQPRVDVYENQDEILLQVEMPGVAKADINLDLDNGRLSLTGSRTGSGERTPLYAEFGPVLFSRAFSVPQTVDGNQVKAELREGILHLHLPKSEAFKPRIIEIREG